ncbi:type II toxin-antitoxin system RelE/ParE family toxin [Lacibacterium aquatile]|uniref:Type II toxin-antitoxin system RelE/ParE family toxin n=1 Tax=Lacibacterium aquatile TaxID=1168082 RepID=A0ABW5DN24_9PROT
MEIKWSEKALSDIARLYRFLEPVNRAAAARTINSLATAPNRLSTHPKIGEKLEQFSGRDVRRLLIGAYELRYEVLDRQVIILRIWHTREAR